MNDEIRAIFHQVKTDFPGHGTLTGFFVLARCNGNLVIWWRAYKTEESNSQSNSFSSSNQEAEIILSITNIQKIMVNYQKNEGYILISTINPTNMHQFTCHSGSNYQLIHFVQLLALYQKEFFQTKTNLIESMNFISKSYSRNENSYRLIDIPVDSGKIDVPTDFEVDINISNFSIVIQPQLHIISSFKVKTDEYTMNPVQPNEFSKFKSISTLKSSTVVRGIEKNLRPEVWPIIFGIIPFIENERSRCLKARTLEYLQIQREWQLLSNTQISRNKVIRDAFTTIRVDIKRTRAPPFLNCVPNWSEFLLRTIKTFTTWNYDVSYTQGINDLLLLFLSVFLPYSSANQQNNSPLYSADEAEAMAFWCFSSFVEKIGSGLISENIMSIQTTQLNDVMKIIEAFHPACAEWLKAVELSDLSFLISSYILAFGRSFETSAVFRVWETLISVENPSQFIKFFTASLLILSFPSFMSIPHCSTGKLVSLMDQIFYKLDIGAIIGVALAMLKNRNNRKIVQGNEQDFTKKSFISKASEISLYTPDESYQKIYQNFDNLFS